MTKDTNIKQIANEEEAKELILSLLEGKYDNQLLNIKYKNWPQIHVTIKGERYHHSLPTPIMAALLELQDTLYRTYAEAKYNGDLRSLTTEEKHQLELLFTIDEGSTDIKADLSGMFTKMGQSMLQDPNNFKAFVIGLTLTGITYIGARYYERVKQQALEATKHETDKQIIEKALQIADRAVQTQLKIPASAYDAEEVTIGNDTYTQQEIQELNKRTRTSTDEEAYNDIFIIDGITNWKTKDGTSATITLINQQTGKTITAKLNKTDEDFTETDKQRLLEAMRQEKPIKLAILQRKRPDGTPTSSKIVTIKDIIEENEAQQP